MKYSMRVTVNASQVIITGVWQQNNTMKNYKLIRTIGKVYMKPV